MTGDPVRGRIRAPITPNPAQEPIARKKNAAGRSNRDIEDVLPHLNQRRSPHYLPPANKIASTGSIDGPITQGWNNLLSLSPIPRTPTP